MTLKEKYISSLLIDSQTRVLKVRKISQIGLLQYKNMRANESRPWLVLVHHYYRITVHAPYLLKRQYAIYNSIETAIILSLIHQLWSIVDIIIKIVNSKKIYSFFSLYST